MSLMLLDHSARSFHLLDITPSGLLLGALLVLAVAALTIAAANALTRKSSVARPGDSGGDSQDDVWPPPPRR